MGLHLTVFALDWSGLLANTGNILLAAVALGLVIFVHELGHFAVAKMCNVQCDKFYLGFDIAGLRFFRFKWGETEYGIGILPLGGYVKMLGQEDNPARLREEIERARGESAKGAGDESATTGGDDPPPTPEMIGAAERALYSPRSFLAKSIPQRMAIISAGVIMNVIFAFVAASVAYWIGVEQETSSVGGTMPGEAAWRAGIRPGDEILQIAGKPTATYLDVRKGISLGDLENGLPLLIRRPGVQEPFTLTVHPDRFSSRGNPTIGILNETSTTLNREGPCVASGSVAAAADPGFKPGDKVVAINRVPVESAEALNAQLALHAADPIEVTVLRSGKHAEKPKSAAAADHRITIHVAANPMRDVGLVMKMGPIEAVQADSPATEIGLKRGDLIEGVETREMPATFQPDDASWIPLAYDPMTLPERLHGLPSRALTEVRVKVLRNGQSHWLPHWGRSLLLQNYELVLGAAYPVLNEVQAVKPHGPAAAAGFKPGDVIVKATIWTPKHPKNPTDDELKKLVEIDFSTHVSVWPKFMAILQGGEPGLRVEFTLADGRSLKVQPAPAGDWFNPSRGFYFEPSRIKQKAASVAAAIKSGAVETADATLIIFSILGKLGSQISPTQLSGPVGIAQAAFYAAEEGIPRLLLLLTAISANLAVINFLPIPVLDGGLMVFMVWEAIRGKPASEKAQVILTYIGLLFIVGLMFFVLALDIGVIPRATSIGGLFVAA